MLHQELLIKEIEINFFKFFFQATSLHLIHKTVNPEYLILLIDKYHKQNLETYLNDKLLEIFDNYLELGTLLSKEFQNSYKLGSISMQLHSTTLHIKSLAANTCIGSNHPLYTHNLSEIQITIEMDEFENP